MLLLKMIELSFNCKYLINRSGSTLVKVLCYRTLVRSQLVSLDFSLTYKPSERTMALGSTQPVTEMSTSSISWG